MELINPATRNGVLVDARGNPLHAQMGDAAHYGADLAGNELRGWMPPVMSADAELLPELETLRGRTNDLIRNQGLLSGGVQIQLDNVVGPDIKLSAKPDWRRLGQSAEWAHEWSRNTEAAWREYAYDPDNYIDLGRRLMFPGLVAQGYRSMLTSFEILAITRWRPKRGGQFATTIQMIDPARLSNPSDRQDSARLRAGVQLDADGAATGYHISNRLRDDPLDFQMLSTDQVMRRWQKVPRQTRWGRQNVCHLYDQERPGQTRGKGGIVSVIAESQMLKKYKAVNLQAAILNAMYAAVIESSLDWDTVGQAIGVAGMTDPLTSYLQNKALFHKDGHVQYDGVKIPHLFPGEKLEFSSPKYPTSEFNSFEESVIRNLAGGMNLTYEQLSRDYSKSNYSSVRAALMDAHRFFLGQRKRFTNRFCTWIYALWLEEAMDAGVVELPDGAPDFYDAKASWCKADWIGPPQGNIDPLKEKKATQVDFQLGLTTLEREAAARGEDWEDLIAQQAREKARIKEMGAVDPYGAGGNVGVSTNEADMVRDGEEDPDAEDIAEGAGRSGD